MSLPLRLALLLSLSLIIYLAFGSFRLINSIVPFNYESWEFSKKKSNATESRVNDDQRLVIFSFA
jgi:hypothetical protein